MIICEIPTKSRKESRKFVHFLLKRNGKGLLTNTDLQRLIKTSETADKRDWVAVWGSERGEVYTEQGDWDITEKTTVGKECEEVIEGNIL